MEGMYSTCKISDAKSPELLLATTSMELIPSLRVRSRWNAPLSVTSTPVRLTVTVALECVEPQTLTTPSSMPDSSCGDNNVRATPAGAGNGASAKAGVTGGVGVGLGVGSTSTTATIGVGLGIVSPARSGAGVALVVSSGAAMGVSTVSGVPIEIAGGPVGVGAGMSVGIGDT